MIEIENFRKLKDILNTFREYDIIVIIARYDYGKSSLCTDIPIDFFGEDRSIYCTFTDQSKPNFHPRKNQLLFGQPMENKTIIIDELTDDNGRDMEGYIAKLMLKNKLIILTNPYGSSEMAEKEVELFIKNTALHLPKRCLFIYVKKGLK